MKKVFLAATLMLALGVHAQKHTNLSQSINDDGKKMVININGTVEGKSVDYHKTFNVEGLTDEEKENIKNQIFDSLGIKLSTPPAAPPAPAIAREPKAKSSAEPPAPPVPPVPPAVIVSADPDQPELLGVEGDHQAYAYGGKNPYTKEVVFNSANKTLYMRYRFKKNGNEMTYEKTVDIKDKSKEECNQIIRQYEKEIGLIKTQKL